MSVFANKVLEGHVALVTGGGTGICRGIARELAAHGAAVCITSRKQEVLDETAAQMREETGGDILAMAADVRKPDDLEAVVAKTVETFGSLDTLVNGAAGNFLAPAVNLSSNTYKTVIEIDLQGTFNASKAAFEHLKASKQGLILNISATLQLHGTPMQVHACSAKAGIDAQTRCLAVEWGPHIRVVGIAPGPIGDTEGFRRLAPGDLGKKMQQKIPMRRFGAIKEVADLAVFLRTGAANYINGTTIVIDGGESVAIEFGL